MQVREGCVVNYTCALDAPDGTRLYQSAEPEPDVFLFGVSPIPEAIRRALAGCVAGDALQFTAPAELAFGAHDPSLVRAIPRADWPAEVPAVVGPFGYRVMQADGPPITVQGRVLAVDDASVHVDQNHPWAGLELQVTVRVLLVREATATERRQGVALAFPFDVLAERDLPGELGRLLNTLAPDCMVPPFPWGQVLYASLLSRVEGLEGDVAELGVGLGGTSLFFASLQPSRTVYALDTYAGLPPDDPTHDNPYFTEGLYDGNVDLVERLEQRARSLDLDNVRPVRGLFCDTADQLPEHLVLAHLDSDLYASVLDSLEATYDRLQDGGILIVDDFFHSSQGPARALATFCNQRGLAPRLQVVFPYSVGFVKGSPPAPRETRCHDGFAYGFEWLRGEPLLREAVRASVDRSWPGSEAHRCAALLLAILESPHDAPHHIYDYWRCLSAFWQGAAGGFFHPDRIG